MASESAPAVAPVVLSSKVFDCFSPPPQNSVAGTIIPKALNRHRKRRKVAIQVQRQGKVEECFVRVMDPLKKHAHHDDIDDSSTAAGVPAHYRDSGSSLEGYVNKYKFPVRTVQIKGTHKEAVTLHISLDGRTQVRDLIFDDVSTCTQFCSKLRKEQSNETARATSKMQAVLGKEIPNEELVLLVEVVSGWNLPAGDLFSSDPYVVCSLGSKEVHRTKHISKTLDPIWTLKHHSLFLLEVASSELFQNDGLQCVVYDFDKVGNNDPLGMFRITAQQMYEAKGERMEFKLLSPAGSKDPTVPGHMAMRVRRASAHDKSFMEKWLEQEKQVALIKRKAPREEGDGNKGKSGLQSLMTRNQRTVKEGPHKGKKVMRVRPGPDPTREQETTWMLESAIEKECMKESKNWVDVGDGKLGKLYVEIIGCDGLPNLDTGGFAGNKTDTFVSLVYEDAVARTDVIDDSLSPRWLPWSQRAFVFHMMHTSSQLFVGAFDYDVSVAPTDDHDLIGRVSVDVSNLRKDTVYLLKYNLYTTAKMSNREQLGTITLRLRMEFPDERALVLSTMTPPPTMYVNTKSRKDFRVVRFTCTGKYDMDAYNRQTLFAYVEELTALQEVKYYIEDAIMTLLLWRGTALVPFTDYKAPVHSLTAFIAFTLLVERPQLMPSFFFASIAWLLLATNGNRRTVPDMWSHCKPFDEFVRGLSLGFMGSKDTIPMYNHKEESQAYLENWKKRITDAEAAAARAYEEQIRQQEEYAKEMGDVDDNTDISTKKGGISVDPLKVFLYPLQQNLALVIRYVRHAKYILLWDECFISFWITMASLVLAFLCLFVPWFFLIKWTSRLVVWTVFGPWMKLVDVYYVSKIVPLSAEEETAKREQAREARLKTFSKARSAARVRRENAAKLKAMKKYLFGKFIIRVPILKEDRYRDIPLPESTAKPYKPNPKAMSEVAMEEAGYNRIRRPGQHLEGDMIPRGEKNNWTQSPKGLATTKETPATDSAAYAKVGGLVVAAGVLTWVGVPLMGAAVQYLRGF